MRWSDRFGWLAAGLLLSLSLGDAFAGSGFGFGPAQGQAAAGGGSGDLTAVTVTGNALSVSSGTGPVPDLSAAAVLEAIVNGGGAATCGAGTQLDVTATGGLLAGASTSGWLLRVGAYTSGTGNLVAREGDDSGWVGVEANQIRVRDSGDVTNAALNQNGFLYTINVGGILWATGTSLDGSPVYDLQLAKSAAKTLTLDDGAAGAVTLSAVGNITATTTIAATTSVSGGTNVTGKQFVGTVTALSDLSIDFGDGAIQTKTEATNVTFTLTANGLGAGRACTVIVTSTGGGTVTYPSAIATANGWLGTAPTTLAAGERLVLQLYCLGNNESDVVACASVLGAGS